MHTRNGRKVAKNLHGSSGDGVPHRSKDEVGIDMARTEAWGGEGQDALKHYRHAADLEQHAALSWPAVQALISTWNSPVTALRQVLEEAISQLEGRPGKEAHLLRDHYLSGRSIKALAFDYAVDVSNLHRWRRRQVQEVAEVIAERNRQAEAASRARRFLVRQPIFGFTLLVGDLVDRLCDPAAPAIIVLEGMGGLGKTTLAQLVAAEVAAGTSFADVLWTSAKQVEFDVWVGKQRIVRSATLQPDEILRQLARQLGIQATRDAAELRREVIARCKQRPYLLVMDNLETITDMTALGPLIEVLAVPSRILITTRDHAPDALPPTLPRHYVALGELDALTSVQILRGAAEHLGASELGAASNSDLGAICQVTGGNPLALWLVAGQAHDL